MHVRRSVSWFAASLLLLGGSAACGGGGSDGTTPPPPPVLTTLSVVVSPASLIVGQTAAASASGLDQNGASISTGTVQWTTSNSSVATVTAAGVVTAVGAGQAQITGTAGGKSAQTTVTVAAPLVTTTVTVSLSASTVIVGQTVTATATALDQNGAPLSGRSVTWSTGNAAIATVTQAGVVTGVAAGTTTVIATIDGKVGQATITVTAAPLVTTTVTVSLSSSTVVVGQTVTATATALDQNGAPLSGRSVTWSTGNPAVATVTQAGVVTGVAAGTTTVIATIDGKVGQATINVTAVVGVQCTSTNALQLALGEIRTLTAAQVASLCLGGASTGSEFVLIPFNNSNVAAQTTSIQITATNTVAVTATPNVVPVGGVRLQAIPGPNPQLEAAFRARERRDLAFLNGSARTISRTMAARTAARTAGRTAPSSALQLTGIPANPAVGSIVQLNGNVSGNTCSAAKQLLGARVVSVTPHVIVFIDTLAPTGGYTDAELAAFGQTFEDVGYGLDTLNFGGVTDIDNNGRVGVFFTTGVNRIPSPAGGGFIAGLFAGRDLFPLTSCIASNEGEMFYLPVPDPNKTINGNYGTKSTLANTVLATLVHEFQHLINESRRIYVNNAISITEEVWLNEGLSHIAEELLYYRESGNLPRSNIDVALLRSSQAQLDAVNTYQIQNLSRLKTYLAATATNSPYAQNDDLSTRGAIWELLRYSADQLGGTERNTWFSLVNTTATGQQNFNAVFGNIVTNTRDWAVAQFMDDIGLSVPIRDQNLSWNFRSVLPAITTGSRFPLTTLSLVAGTPLSIDIIGGGAAYVRFRVAPGAPATIGSTSSAQPVPANIDFILARTL